MIKNKLVRSCGGEIQDRFGGTKDIWDVEVRITILGRGGGHQAEALL